MLHRATAVEALSLHPRRSHPDVAFFIGRQDHRHRLRMYRLNDRVRCRRQEAVDEMRPGDRLRFGATVALELSPEPAKGEQRTVVVEREPHHVFLFGLWVRLGRVFSKAVRRDEAAIFRIQPTAPVRR